MDEDDEFGDLYSDVLQPFQPPVVLPSPPHPPAHRSIDLNLRSQDQDGAEANSASVSRVLDNDASKLSVTLSQDATRPAIGDDGGGGDEKDMNFDIEEPDADSAPAIPGLFVAASEGGGLPGLATDRGVPQVTIGIEQLGGDGGYGGQGEGDDWDSDSEDDLQIVLNDSSRNVMLGADRRSRMGDNEDDDDEDDEEPLVIVADTDPNQPMEEQLWGEDGLQVVDGDGKDGGGEAGKGSGPGGATGPPKAGYSSHGYHPFHSQFKYVRPGAAPIPGGAVSTGGTSSGQVRPPANLGPVAGRGRGDWRPMGMRNASAAQKGFHQSWGSNTAGRGLDFTLPSHKTIFEVDIESFEENPWKYPGVDITDYFNFGLDEESWKDYCKQLDQHRIETTMQSRIRVYESGRTDQGYDPDLPPELAAATGAQGAPVDSSNLVKQDTAQGDSTKVPAHVRPSLPPGRPIPVETGSGERLPSIDTRAPRMRDLDAIIEIVCQDSHEDEPLCENGAEQADSSLRGENIPVETGNINRRRPDVESVGRSPVQDEPREKQDDDISSSTDSGQSFRSLSLVGDRGTRSSSVDREDVGGEASKDAEMEEHKLSSSVPQSAVQEDDGGELKMERSSESSKARSESHRDYQQLKDGAEEEVSQDKHYTRPDSNRKQHDNNAPHQNRKNQDRGKEMERTRAGSRGGRENSFPHPEFDSSYVYSIASREDFDQRKERDGDGGIWRRKEDDPYSKRGGDDGSRKRNREDDPGSRQRGKIRESALRNKDDHVSRKHLDDVGMRNTYEVNDHISKRRKDDEYMRRSRPEKNEISYGQRESTSHLKRERDDRLEHQKRDVQHKIRDDFDDHSSLRLRDEIYMQRDGNERMRERDGLDKLKLIHEDGLSARGRERQVAARGHRGSEDRSSRMKDEYKASDREHLTKDTTRHTKQTKRREYPGEESSSHHKGHEDFSARTDNIVNNETKPRQERASAKSDKVIDTLDAQRLQDRKHKDSRRKMKEQREGAESSRSKQGKHNGSSEVTGSKRNNEARNSRNEIPQQPNSTKRHKENAFSGDDLQDSKKGRTKLERWASQKERDDAVPAKSSSITLKHQENEKSSNGRLSEPVHSSIGKNQDVTEEKCGHDLAETKDGSEKVAGDQHLDTFEKLKKRSERFKLPMPTEKDTTVVKKIEPEMLHSVKIEGPVDSEVKAERPARKRRWTSS